MVGGSVGKWKVVGGLVGRWSVVGGFNKTLLLHLKILMQVWKFSQKLSEWRDIGLFYDQTYDNISTRFLIFNDLLDYAERLSNIIQGKQQLCIHLLYETLVLNCEYATQIKGSF